jgi:hypothetical protein
VVVFSQILENTTPNTFDFGIPGSFVQFSKFSRGYDTVHVCVPRPVILESFGHILLIFYIIRKNLLLITLYRIFSADSQFSRLYVVLSV